jgi:hypothetical protein
MFLTSRISGLTVIREAKNDYNKITRINEGRVTWFK